MGGRRLRLSGCATTFLRAWLDQGRVVHELKLIPGSQRAVSNGINGRRMESEILQQLEKRLGHVHARQRLGIESESEPRVFGKGLNFFHPENWYSFHSLVEYGLRLSGFYWRGHRNTLDIRVRRNEVRIKNLPSAFDGFSILHMSDLHADLNPPAMDALAELVSGLEYDACVLTGDYRAGTSGPHEPALRAMAGLCTQLLQPVYGVFGNHDSIRMLPGMESMGIRMLLNEHARLERGTDSIYLVGVDDPHYYRVDNLASAAADIPANAVSILLSHTPEIYRQAAYAGFDLMLCGHTHGGQICLPGGIPLTLDSKCPRYMGSGAWTHAGMQAYTTVGAGTCIVPVRLNCPPEVVIHRLSAASVGMPADTESVQQPRQHHIGGHEAETQQQHLGPGKGQKRFAGQQRQHRFRYVIQPGGHGAGCQAETAFDKTGGGVPEHGKDTDRDTDLPRPAQRKRKQCGRQHGRNQASPGL